MLIMIKFREIKSIKIPLAKCQELLFLQIWYKCLKILLRLFNKKQHLIIVNFAFLIILGQAHTKIVGHAKV